MELYYTVSTNLVFDKVTSGNTTALDILWYFIEASHPLASKDKDVSTVINKGIKELESGMGELGTTETNEQIIESYTVVAAILFKLRWPAMISFANKFFQAIYV